MLTPQPGEMRAKVKKHRLEAMVSYPVQGEDYHQEEKLIREYALEVKADHSSSQPKDSKEKKGLKSSQSKVLTLLKLPISLFKIILGEDLTTQELLAFPVISKGSSAIVSEAKLWRDKIKRDFKRHVPESEYNLADVTIYHQLQQWSQLMDGMKNSYIHHDPALF